MADRTDDGSVGDDELLWRRLYPDWVERDESGNVRARSMAFIDRKSGEISVHRAHLTTETFVLRDHPSHGLAGIAARIPRGHGYAVIADPIEGEVGVADDPSHALLVPPSESGSKRIKALARQLATSALLVRLPSAPVTDSTGVETE